MYSKTEQDEQRNSKESFLLTFKSSTWQRDLVATVRPVTDVGSSEDKSKSSESSFTREQSVPWNTVSGLFVTQTHHTYDIRHRSYSQLRLSSKDFEWLTNCSV